MRCGGNLSERRRSGEGEFFFLALIVCRRTFWSCWFGLSVEESARLDGDELWA